MGKIGRAAAHVRFFRKYPIHCVNLTFFDVEAGNERAVIHLAMEEWEQHTCIKFRPSNSTDRDKLVFQNGIG